MLFFAHFLYAKSLVAQCFFHGINLHDVYWHGVYDLPPEDTAIMTMPANPLMLEAEHWQDYRLIDSGHGRKLEEDPLAHLRDGDGGEDRVPGHEQLVAELGRVDDLPPPLRMSAESFIYPSHDR